MPPTCSTSSPCVYIPPNVPFTFINAGDEEELYQGAGQRDWMKRNKRCMKAYVHIMEEQNMLHAKEKENAHFYKRKYR